MTTRHAAEGEASIDPVARILGAPRDRPFVVAQLGQSLDGRIATESGESRWINQQAALVHVHRIRAAVDAVMVGIGTVIADDPKLNVRHVSGRNPARVIIDPRGRMPPAAQCLADDGCRRIIVRATDTPVPPGVELIRIPETEGSISPHAIRAALHAAGLHRILLEGGAGTISGFLAAGAVDRLHVLVAPVILGSGKPGLSLPPIARLADALRPPTEVQVLADGDVLFDCDLATSQNEGRRHGAST